MSDGALLEGRPLSMLEVIPRSRPGGLRVLCLRGPGEGVSRLILEILGAAWVAERVLDDWKSRTRTSLVSDIMQPEYDVASIKDEC